MGETVVVLGGTVPASGGMERMSTLLKAGTFPRDSSLIPSPEYPESTVVARWSRANDGIKPDTACGPGDEMKANRMKAEGETVGKNKLVMAGLAVMLAAALSGPAFGGISMVAVEDPVATGSWNQKFRVISDNVFNTITAVIDKTRSTTVFEQPRVFESFSDESWGIKESSDARGKASGSGLRAIELDFHFEGDYRDSDVVTHIQIKDDDKDQGCVEARYKHETCKWEFEDNCSHICPPGDGNHGCPTVPAPGAIVLGSFGMGLVGWLRRRQAM